MQLFNITFVKPASGRRWIAMYHDLKKKKNSDDALHSNIALKMV